MVQGALGRSAGESIMSNITVRPMAPEDWAAVSEIYLEGIATEHATFQTTCPPYKMCIRDSSKGRNRMPKAVV